MHNPFGGTFMNILYKDRIFCFIIILIVFAFFLYFRCSIDLMRYVLPALITLLGVYMTASIAIFNVNKTLKSNEENSYATVKASYENKERDLLDNLDSKSEWRKQLYDVASKTFLTTDDVYRVLASLRYLPKSSESDKFSSFSRPTREIYNEMYSVLDNYKENINSATNNAINGIDKTPIVFLSFEYSEKVRLYTKYLLKHHWEYNNYQEKNKFMKNEDEIFNEVKTEVRKINTIYTHLSKQKRLKGVSTSNYKK